MEQRLPDRRVAPVKDTDREQRALRRRACGWVALDLSLALKSKVLHDPPGRVKRRTARGLYLKISWRPLAGWLRA